MLDVVVVNSPTAAVTDVVSIEEFARHIRLSSHLRSKPEQIALMTDALTEALDKLEGPNGELRRCIRPCTLRRYINSFPQRGGEIQLPYPDLIAVDGIMIEAGAVEVPPASYVVGGELISTVKAVGAWPGITAGKRAASITYQAGYLVYPPALKRMVKILAAHYLENPEATINEPRQMAINRRVEFGMDDLRATFQVPLSYDDWNE